MSSPHSLPGHVHGEFLQQQIPATHSCDDEKMTRFEELFVSYKSIKDDVIFLPPASSASSPSDAHCPTVERFLMSGNSAVVPDPSLRPSFMWRRSEHFVRHFWHAHAAIGRVVGCGCSSSSGHACGQHTMRLRRVPPTYPARGTCCSFLLVCLGTTEQTQAKRGPRFPSIVSVVTRSTAVTGM